MQASKHQAAASSRGLSIMCKITGKMQPKHQERPVERHLAAAVEQMTRTTSPGSCCSRRRWRMGQLRLRPGRLLQAQEAVLGERPGRRTAEVAAAAVSSCYPDHHRCHDACYYSFPAALGQRIVRLLQSDRLTT